MRASNLRVAPHPSPSPPASSMAALPGTVYFILVFFDAVRTSQAQCTADGGRRSAAKPPHPPLSISRGPVRLSPAVPKLFAGR
ncbi:hypothetical protein ColLi_07985 [Colletotrichum liriopes]|uniref:Uncharacterized protein n=1 Tax=Colletotrichum liriopes TaxID=708192 RepID=A0AA37GQL6_9PEZI|nr:hypothetical protein ColLi_07985 [Colletotrichum liriopes]